MRITSFWNILCSKLANWVTHYHVWWKGSDRIRRKRRMTPKEKCMPFEPWSNLKWGSYMLTILTYSKVFKFVSVWKRAMSFDINYGVFFRTERKKWYAGSAFLISAHPALTWGYHWIQLSRLLPDGRQHRNCLRKVRMSVVGPGGKVIPTWPWALYFISKCLVTWIPGKVF